MGKTAYAVFPALQTECPLLYQKGEVLMRYYVTADVHGYFSQLKAALAEQGFFDDTEPHKLIICGDLFDRGAEAVALQEFILDLLNKEQVILIRGNHEDLALQLLHDWHHRSFLHTHHHTNGTIDTLCQLTGITTGQLYDDPETAGRDFLRSPYIQTIIPAMVDYYETDRFIFVHGWIPCSTSHNAEGNAEYAPIVQWREADPTLWNKARWINGMEAAHFGIVAPGKTIVCGHWHCSFGHCHYENDGDEFFGKPNFSPYCAEGIIALDACTPLSGKVNCIVIED